MKIHKTYGIQIFLLALFWALWLQLQAGPTKSKTEGIPSTNVWFLSPKETWSGPEWKVIDTRSFVSRMKDRLPSAIVLGWEELSQGKDPERGKLKRTDLVQKKLESLGLKPKDHIIVLGDGKSGWGEEGRIVWSLREVGFENVYWYDGSFSSFLDGITSQNKKNVPSNGKPEAHSFAAQEKVTKTDITKEEISKQLTKGTFQILDTRETREFFGSTPYGEKRGGHIPGAKSFYYQNLYDENGMIKSKEEVENSLTALGITKSKPIIAYCTGGVRSAFVVGILRSYGYHAYNYSGSMWEWSSDPTLPLEK